MSRPMEVVGFSMSSNSGLHPSPHGMQIQDNIQENSTSSSMELDILAISRRHMAVMLSEEHPVPPFNSFICPLSREVMKQPVVLVETEQAYDQNEIEKWFESCAVDGRKPTCPVTGQVLNSTELRRNHVLEKTIEEWHQRNYEIRITRAKQKLSSDSSTKDYEDAVVEVHKIAEESITQKSILGSEGVIPLLSGPWQGHAEQHHHIRCKVLMAAKSISTDNRENKLQLARENFIRCAVKSLTSDIQQERECAAELLCELSCEPEIRAQIGSQKGAILLLSGLQSNGENASLASLAEQTLKNLEEEPLNVIAMAQMGRMEPLLNLLCKGSLDKKLAMANFLSEITLSRNDKEVVTKRSGQVLIDMLSEEHAEKVAPIKVLLTLSASADNASLLVRNGILLPLFSFINSIHSISDTLTIELKENAVEILANIVMKPGYWELALVTKNGDTLQSKSVIHCLLGLLTRVGFKWRYNLLNVLHSIARSSQAEDGPISHIESGNGIRILLVIVREPDLQTRVITLKLMEMLSSRYGTELADELRQTQQFNNLKELLKGSRQEEQAAAASILANTLITEREILEVLGVGLIPWILVELDKYRRIHLEFGDATTIDNISSLLSLLLQYCKYGSSILQDLKEHQIMLVLKEYLVFPGAASVKIRAATGLQVLSQKAALCVDVAPIAQPSCCIPFLNGRKSQQCICYVHDRVCEEAATLCLVKVSAIKPLVQLLKHEDVGVQLACVGALSTIIEDSKNVKAGLEELAKEAGISSIIDLFCHNTKHGELQEKLVWMVERITRFSDICQTYSVNQVLIKTLIQTFRSGHPITKRLAQQALTNLRQISGMAAKPAM